MKLRPLPARLPSSLSVRTLRGRLTVPARWLLLGLFAFTAAGALLQRESAAQQAPAGGPATAGKAGADRPDSGKAEPGKAEPGKSKGGRGGAPAVVLAPATRHDFQVWQDSLGTVTPLANVTVRSRVDGELLRVLFREGQSVRKGDLLAEIDPRSFQVQLDQAQAVLARDQALLENARTDLRRYRDLAQQEAIPRQQLDTQESLVRQYEASLRTDQASIDSARLQLGFCRITAPISGQIGLRLVDPGNIVHASDAGGLVSITQMQPISALFSLPQDLLPALQKRRQRGSIEVQALDRAGRDRLAQGRVLSQDNQIDTSTGTLRLRASFDNRDGALYPNQFVNVRVLMDLRKDAILVPTSALQRGSQGPYVFLFRPDQTVTVRAIRPGPADRGEIVVEDGLAAGDQVVIDGADKLREGMQVTVAERTRKDKR